MVDRGKDLQPGLENSLLSLEPDIPKQEKTIKNKQTSELLLNYFAHSQYP
jgi:hypothetical protein